MEGARQFQDRILRDTSRRVGWAYAGRVRRSGDHSQVLFNASCFRIRGATRHYGRGSRPQRTRGHCLARWTETEVMVILERVFSLGSGVHEERESGLLD